MQKIGTKYYLPDGAFAREVEGALVETMRELAIEYARTGRSLAVSDKFEMTMRARALINALARTSTRRKIASPFPTAKAVIGFMPDSDYVSFEDVVDVQRLGVLPSTMMFDVGEVQDDTDI